MSTEITTAQLQQQFKAYCQSREVALKTLKKICTTRGLMEHTEFENILHSGKMSTCIEPDSTTTKSSLYLLGEDGGICRRCLPELSHIWDNECEVLTDLEYLLEKTPEPQLKDITIEDLEGIWIPGSIELLYVNAESLYMYLRGIILSGQQAFPEVWRETLEKLCSDLLAACETLLAGKPLADWGVSAPEDDYYVVIDTQDLYDNAESLGKVPAGHTEFQSQTNIIAFILARPYVSFKEYIVFSPPGNFKDIVDLPNEDRVVLKSIPSRETFETVQALRKDGVSKLDAFATATALI